MHLSSIHSADEERFIVSGIRQSSDYSAGSVYWLGARLAGEDENILSWIDGSAMGYQGWPPYNDTEDVDATCLGVQVNQSQYPPTSMLCSVSFQIRNVSSNKRGRLWNLLKLENCGSYMDLWTIYGSA